MYVIKTYVKLTLFVVVVIDPFTPGFQKGFSTARRVNFDPLPEFDNTRKKS